MGKLCIASFCAERFVDLFGRFAERKTLFVILARVCDVAKVNQCFCAFCAFGVLCFIPEFFLVWVRVLRV